MTDDPVNLPDVPRLLKQDYDVFVSYRRLYMAVLDGDIPASRGSNGRWQVDVGDLAAIAEIFE